MKNSIFILIMIVGLFNQLALNAQEIMMKGISQSDTFPNGKFRTEEILHSHEKAQNLEYPELKDYYDFADIKIGAFRNYVDILSDPSKTEQHEMAINFALELFLNTALEVELDTNGLHMNIEAYLLGVSENSEYMWTSFEDVFPLDTLEYSIAHRQYEAIESIKNRKRGESSTARVSVRNNRIINTFLIWNSMSGNESPFLRFKVKLGSILMKRN